MSQEQQWQLIDGNGNQCGPYSADQLQGFASDGTVVPTTLLWTEGLETWTPASEVEGLSLSQPKVRQLLTGATVQAARPMGPTTPTATPGAASLPVAHPRTGATALIVIGVTIPLLIVAVFVIYSQSKNSREPAPTVKVEKENGIIGELESNHLVSIKDAPREQPASKDKLTPAPSAVDPDSLNAQDGKIETLQREHDEALGELGIQKDRNAELIATIENERSKSRSLKREIEELRANPLK